MKKTFLTALFLIALSLNSYAQNWLTDINIAKDIAQNEEKNILLVFSGSDWCAPCIKLERNIWKSEAFIKFSKDHFVLVKADFPRKKKNQLNASLKKHNHNLAEKYNPNGHFPLVLVLNSSGKILGTTGYKKLQPKKFIELLISFEH